MLPICEVAIIGAGPYGLSIAAHLKSRGVDFRIFGKPLATWTTQMPKGMQLKSYGFASSLSDPGQSFDYKAYCRERNIAYSDPEPPTLAEFVDYGTEFQRRFVPKLDERMVESLERGSDGFTLRFAGGGDVMARRVIVATGLTHFACRPAVFDNLPREMVTHSSEHHELSGFKGRKVAVIGAGASATDLAGLLHEQGAEVHIIARGAQIGFHGGAPGQRPLRHRLRSPSTVIGTGWRAYAMAKAPLLFWHLKQDTRLAIVRTYLGPDGQQNMRDRVIGRVAIQLGLTPVQAKVRDGKIAMTLANNGGEERSFEADHVICATGFTPDLARLPFIDAAFCSQIQAVKGTPVLSSNFESSIPGLYFAGFIAANTFGPLLRFVCGSEFAAPRLARHLARGAQRLRVQPAGPAGPSKVEASAGAAATS